MTGNYSPLSNLASGASFKDLPFIFRISHLLWRASNHCLPISENWSRSKVTYIGILTKSDLDFIFQVPAYDTRDEDCEINHIRGDFDLPLS
jgi:hypothetical protein